MSVDILLSKLDKVKRTGAGRWLACCPAHADKGPSLSIREMDDGRILLHDFGAGCSVHEIVQAVGLDITDLFPPGPRSVDDNNRSPTLAQRTLPERRPFPAADVLRAVAFESLVVSAAAAALLAGEPFGEADRARLVLAAARINGAVSAAGVNHGF